MRLGRSRTRTDSVRAARSRAPKYCQYFRGTLSFRAVLTAEFAAYDGRNY